MAFEIISSLSLPTETVRDSYQLLRRVTLHHLHSLLECMTDTYEENKHEAFKLLLACTNKHRNLLVGAADLVLGNSLVSMFTLQM